MASAGFCFDRFCLDPANRQLSRDDAPVELNARYLDALALLVSEQGRLVSKDRFLDEVWHGVPVTDEALTQCIRTLRRQLGDDAGRPRFIETVPKHGYRFIAPVERVDDETEPPRSLATWRWRDFLTVAAAGTIGGAAAGLLGGLLYGLVGALQPVQEGIGALSALLVLVSITTVVALVGAAGVAFGIAAAAFVSGRMGPWIVVGGAVGGLLIGAFVKLLGQDAFQLLVGRSPGDITGAGEGAMLGGVIGLGCWVTTGSARAWSPRRSAAFAALAGAAAGILIPLLGGQMMAGSLDALTSQFPNSRLRLDQLGALFGEDRFGPVTELATGALEAAIFAGCVVGAMLMAHRSLRRLG